MRVTLFLFVLGLILGISLWVTLSGASLFLGLLLLLILTVITIGYVDTATLFFLGAREVKSGVEETFHSAAAQEAYKLALPQPKLYIYNGALERSFVLQNRKNISLVLSKELLEMCTKDELGAIAFELLLQVKSNLAAKRTKVMFIVGMLSWIFHSIVSFLYKLIPLKEVKQSLNLLMYYILHPWSELIFKMTLGEKYFRKVEHHLSGYPIENDLLHKIGSRLRKPHEIYSVSSRKWIEFSTVNKNGHYLNILTLEFLPHEWDTIFNHGLENRV